MSLEEFAWRTVVLAVANGAFMRLAIALFDFGNERNKLLAAILWSIPFSALVHAGLWVWTRTGLYGGGVFWLMSLMLFYAALLKWYDLEIGQTVKATILTLLLDVGTYIALSKTAILPPIAGDAFASRVGFR